MKTIRLISLLSIILFSYTLKAQDVQPVNPNAPEITFTYIEYDYGTINKDANGDSKFTFRNTGKEPLILTNVRSSCGCTVPEWTREPVLPGKEGVIKVKYATSRVGPINKTITVECNAKNSPVILKIIGTVVDVPGTSGPEKPVDGAPVVK